MVSGQYSIQNGYDNIMITGGTPMTWETSESFCIFLRKHEPRYTRAFSRAGYVTESLPTTSFPAFLRRKKKTPPYYILHRLYTVHARTHGTRMDQFSDPMGTESQNQKEPDTKYIYIYIYIYIYLFV